MRTFPGLNVYLPSDRHQSAWLTRCLVNSNESAYVRVGRNAVPDIYKSDDRFEAGKARILRQGSDIALIAAGETVYHALQAAELLKKEGLEAMVIDMFCIKPIDEETILEAARSTRCMLTVEEHSIFGGLGAAVSEIVSQHQPTKMKILGIPDENAIHARPLEVFSHYQLDGPGIYKNAIELIKSSSNDTI
jgi:transketolase